MNSFFNRVTSVFTKNSTSEGNLAPTPQTSQLVLLPAQTDEQELANFNADLDDALDKLRVAEDKSKKTRDELKNLSKTLKDRGWWGAVKANFDGKTDKELATSLQALGLSLETTQQVLRVLLKVQTQKGRLLHTFNDALVSKIACIQADTQTLNGNQRAATLAFLEELRERVQEQIHQQHLIDEHDRQLQALSQWQFEKNNLDVEIGRRIQQQSEEYALWQMQKEQRDAETALQLLNLQDIAKTLNQSVIDLGEWRKVKQSEDQELRSHIAQTEQHVSEQLLQMADSIAKILTVQQRQESHAQAVHQRVEVLQARILELDRMQAQAKSFTAVLRRHSLSLVALTIALAALVKVLLA